MSKLLCIAIVFSGACATNADDDTMMGDDDAPPFTNGVSMLSGAGEPGYVDGARGIARFANPVNVAYGPDGVLYVADFDNNKIRTVDPMTGQTGTLISQNNFKRPFAMTFGPDGTMWVTTDNNATGGHSLMSGSVWRVDVHAKTATIVASDIGRPRGIAVLRDGRLAVSDYTHHVIETIDPNGGQIIAIAGQWDAKGMVDAAGAAARFSTPYGMALNAAGKLVVADFDNNRLRVVSLDGTVETWAGVGAAGFADGALADAKFSHPQGVAVDANGDIYVTDLGNFRVRRVSGDQVETIAGSGTGGFLDNDDKLAAQLFGLEGIGVAGNGSMVFVADGSRGEAQPFNRVRIIKMK